MLARATDELGAANGALALVGEPPLLAAAGGLNSDRNAARQVLANFGTVRDALLEEHEWNFGEMRSAVLVAAGVADDLGRFRYPLPADCLSVWTVSGADAPTGDVYNPRACGERATWSVVGAVPAEAPATRVVLSGLAAPRVVYIGRVDVAAWTALFLTVFQLRLAARLAPTLGRNASLADDLDARAERLLPKVRRRDAQEGSPKHMPRVSTWLQARR